MRLLTSLYGTSNQELLSAEKYTKEWPTSIPWLTRLSMQRSLRL